MIGIIANPASGKDIRRLVSYATVFDNNEKVNIVKRIVLAAQAGGVSRVAVMPDTFRMGDRVAEDLTLEKRLQIPVSLMEMSVKGSQADSTRAAGLMEEQGAGCVVVLGGDGTSRAVAKAIGRVPVLPLSTGTNNVYPDMVEGTIAGMAAAVVAQRGLPSFTKRDKRIEVWKSGALIDIALVDAVISTSQFAGSRAIWRPEQLRRLFVTRCHLASIGFSAIAGCMELVGEQEDYGLCLDLTGKKYQVLAPIAAGVVERIGLGEPERLELNRAYAFVAEERGMVALDGEREIEIEKGETLTFKITREGPYRVNIREVLERAQEAGFFRR